MDVLCKCNGLYQLTFRNIGLFLDWFVWWGTKIGLKIFLSHLIALSLSIYYRQYINIYFYMWIGAIRWNQQKWKKKTKKMFNQWIWDLSEIHKREEGDVNKNGFVKFQKDRNRNKTSTIHDTWNDCCLMKRAKEYRSSFALQYWNNSKLFFLSFVVS